MSRSVVSVLAALAGAVLLVWQVRQAGVADISRGLAEVGWGFALVLGLSLLRFLLRSIAWVTLIGERVPFQSALAATLTGDALGNITPLGPLVSEPAKAVYLDRRIASSRSLAALTAENFFYGMSVAIYIIIGTAAMLEFFELPQAVRSAGVLALVVMAAVLAAAAWMAWQKPALASTLLGRVPIRRLQAVVERVRDFEVRTYGSAGHQGGRLFIVFACHAAFHFVSFLEAWLTLWLLTGSSLPLAAFVLDTFNRVANVVFKMVPFRLGVDQTISEAVARAIGLAPAVGTTMSLVRMGRVMFWAAIGLGLLGRQGVARQKAEGTRQKQ